MNRKGKKKNKPGRRSESVTNIRTVPVSSPEYSTSVRLVNVEDFRRTLRKNGFENYVVERRDFVEDGRKWDGKYGLCRCKDRLKKKRTLAVQIDIESQNIVPFFFADRNDDIYKETLTKFQNKAELNGLKKICTPEYINMKSSGVFEFY